MKITSLATLFFVSGQLTADPMGLVSTKATRMICSERCQLWDNFESACDYRTTCEILENVVTYKECLRWDSLNDSCADEKVIKQYLAFDPFSGSPSCTESCQVQDGFGGCLYRTSCSVQPSCASIRYCEKWNSFNQACDSERVDHACNLRH